METNLIDFDFEFSKKEEIIKPQANYFELEQTIIEQNKKIKLLEDTVNDIQQNVLILKSIHNNFFLELEYIDFVEDYIKYDYSSYSGYIRHTINNSLVKKQLIPITAEKLDFTHAILATSSFARLNNLFNLKDIVIRKDMFGIINELDNNKITIQVDDYYYKQSEYTFKNMLLDRGTLRIPERPNVKIIIGV